MFKKVFKCFTLSAMVATMFIGSACQKDNENNYNLEKELDESNWTVKTDTTDYSKICISKKNYWSKESAVFILDDIDRGKKYKTIKISNMQKTITQEWLYEDLRSEFFDEYMTVSKDTDGERFGFYYLWEENFGDADQEVFDYLVCNAENHQISEKGFHVATRDDIMNLAKILKNSNKIPECLNLGYDASYSFSGVNTNLARIWLVTPDPDKVKGCGVFVEWDKNHGNAMQYYFPNSRDVYMNVRLCRTISQGEW